MILVLGLFCKLKNKEIRLIKKTNPCCEARVVEGFVKMMLSKPSNLLGKPDHHIWNLDRLELLSKIRHDFKKIFSVEPLDDNRRIGDIFIIRINFHLTISKTHDILRITEPYRDFFLTTLNRMIRNSNEDVGAELLEKMRNDA